MRVGFAFVRYQRFGDAVEVTINFMLCELSDKNRVFPSRLVIWQTSP